MRVAQIMLSSDLGGAERSYIEIVRCLALQQFKILTIGIRGGRAEQYFLGKENICVKNISCLNSYDYSAVVQILYHLKTFNPNLIHCHLARATKFGSLAGKVLSIPVVSKTHNLVNPKYYRNTTKIIVTTDAQRKHMIDNGFQEGHLVKIPNFQSSKNIENKNIIGKKKPSGDHFVVKSLGRFVKKKGFDNLIKAIVNLRNEGVAVSLSLAGAGPEKNTLQRLIDGSGHSKEITIMNWIDDINTYLNDADLFVLSSLEEPFGLVILDAMSMCIPILATKTQGPLEVLNNELAYFLETPDCVEIARQIKKVMRDPTRFSKAIKANKEFKNKYSSEAVIPMYRKLYSELLSY